MRDCRLLKYCYHNIHTGADSRSAKFSKMVRFAVAAVLLAGIQGMSCVSASIHAREDSPSPAYLDLSLSPKERAADLIQRMTWEEKVGQLGGIRRPLTRTDGKAIFNKTSFDIIRKTQNGQIGK